MKKKSNKNILIGIVVVVVIIGAILIFQNPFRERVARDGGLVETDQIAGNIDISGLNLPKEGEKTEFGDVVMVTRGRKHIIPLNKLLSGGPGKDGIPSIDNPKFESLEKADKWLDDEDVIFGVNIDGVQRAYPQRILNWHEIVNDNINGKPITVTFCPLCGSALAFDGTINGRAVEFGVSGKLYNSDLVMYDRLTDTYWGQISGKAIVGELVGMRLTKVPVDTLMWRDWKNQFPNTEVLSRSTGFVRDYNRYPYGDYETNSRIIFPVDNRDSRLHEKAVIYGIEIDGRFKAYPIDKLSERVEDDFAGINLEITNNNGIVKFVNKDTGEEIIPARTFWFGWVAIHPDTELFS